LVATEVDPTMHRLVLSASMLSSFERSAGSGQWHGGVVASIVDIAGDYAVAVALGGPVPTISLAVDYLRPATGATLRVVGTCRRAGRTVSLADVEVFDAEGRLVALGRGVYASRPAPADA
jgi:uncharacterized protein (TIGR00369 family)